ncbi:protein of unknown function [Granulicella pectinivorans]|uniref:Uncharacterized protein n=1 Tax=Granulicella pectinivorans TaxID=474950 RepID=A0A1I6MYH2_9BACT|nr:DUF4139 domain-containing protein [Granulicella pectinivorans]SFS20697.1 protein of unknown function [Granulicella pectinivorans]
MRRALPLAFLLLAPVSLLPAQTSVQNKRPIPATAAATIAPLPITRVSLYKNGVGFFEHTGKVTGSEAVTIDFTTAQLNDVLQSLTAIDLGGGRISGAGYNSTTPLDQQLKSLSLGLGADASSVDFYNAIRGARVDITGAGPTLTGRLLSIEVRTVPTKDDATQGAEKRFLTVVSETGAIRTFELTSAVQVRLLDTELHQDVTRYLQLLASTRSSGLRHLTLHDNGEGSRELHVSYISEVPIWKSTYRILFTDSTSTKQTATLQGWSVVDNTTGSDWLNVQLSLIAGAPQSFIQPLSTPYYSRRPEIPLPQEAQVTPQTHESGEVAMLKEDGAPPPSATPQSEAQAITLSSEQRQAKMAPRSYGAGFTGGSAGGVMGGLTQNTLKDRFSNGGLDSSYQALASDSIAPDTTTRAFDDFFEYKIAQPITIRKNESALVPILQTKIDAERVTLWSPQQPVALRALWITNTSNLTLDRGSFTIVEDGSFGGEGLLDPIHPNERRLLSYAADQAVRVTVDNSHDTRKVQHISIAKGVLKETTAEISEVEYLVKNAAPTARTVIVEQPHLQGWTLDSDPKPTETTPTTYRFRVETKANETVRLHIGERRTLNQFYRLVNTSDEQLSLLLKNANASPALLAQLEPVFAAKRAMTAIDQQIREKQQSINDIGNDQKRLRENLSALKSSVEERSLTKRYTDELNAQEDQLAALNKDLAALKQQRQAAEADLNHKIESLHLDEAI